MKTITKIIKIATSLTLVIAVTATVGFYFYIHGLKSALATVDSLPISPVSYYRPISVTSSQNKSVGAVGMALEYAADFSNDRILMGASHNVFVAKVIRQTGDRERRIGPETQFEVQIVLNIKGNLQGMVTLDQEGGYVNGVLYYIQDGVPLLKPGVTYLLATRYNPQENWYTLNPSISGSQFIIDDPNLSIPKLQSMAENDMRVKELEAAYPNEILLDADIKNDNTLNSYASLHGGLPSSSPTTTTSTQ